MNFEMVSEDGRLAFGHSFSGVRTVGVETQDGSTGGFAVRDDGCVTVVDLHGDRLIVSLPYEVTVTGPVRVWVVDSNPTENAFTLEVSAGTFVLRVF